MSTSHRAQIAGGSIALDLTHTHQWQKKWSWVKFPDRGMGMKGKSHASYAISPATALFLRFDAQAATARNAYAAVSSLTFGVERIVPIGAGFYVTTRGVGAPAFRADIGVSAVSPYFLATPASGRLGLGIGQQGGYAVRDESGSEDIYSGHVCVLKLDIEPEETNVCWQSMSCALKLTDDCFPGGIAAWSSSPAGIAGSGNSITFNPSSLAPGVYTVTARSGVVPSYNDTCIVRVVKVEFVTPNGDPALSPVDSGDG